MLTGECSSGHRNWRRFWIAFWTTFAPTYHQDPSSMRYCSWFDTDDCPRPPIHHVWTIYIYRRCCALPLSEPHPLKRSTGVRSFSWPGPR